MSAKTSNVTRQERDAERRGGETRHDARELALQILFQCDFHGSTEFWLEQFWAQQNASESVRGFVSQLVAGVRTHQVELDGLITAYARNWTVQRMPVVDRNILRQAMYELLWIPDVPAKVTVNEALQLAKSFADDETRRFVNAVLDQLIKHDARLELKRGALAH